MPDMSQNSGGTPHPDWSTVDEYFIDALVPQDEALLAARASGAQSTLPKAEISPNQGAFLSLLTQVAGAAALELTRAGAVIVIDSVVRHGEVVRPQSGGLAVGGVRQAVADIAAHPDLEATALQTVGLKGWDGFVIARRR
jgi:predicted O-methyltransferase YrrM